MVIVLFATIIAYVLLLGVYLFGWKRQVLGTAGKSQPQGLITVIIPARNEERNIVACVDSILRQDYDGDFEVIVVDDHSDDETYEVAVHHFETDRRVKVLRLDGKINGKKAALRSGIANATGEFIATADADCTFAAGWLGSMMAEFEYGVQLVTGPVLIEHACNDIEGYQALDLLSLALVTGGGHYHGLHLLGNGANLIFKREAFEKVGGYDSGASFASGDDLFLIQSICAEYGAEAIAYQGKTAGVAWTMPEKTTDDLVRQRLRWASKNSSLTDRSIQLVWAFVWLANVGSVAGILLAIFNIVPIPVVAAYLAVKAGGEYITLRNVASYYGMDRLVSRWFLRSFLLNIAFVSLIGVKALIIKDYTWKGRRTT